MITMCSGPGGRSTRAPRADVRVAAEVQLAQIQNINSKYDPIKLADMLGIEPFQMSATVQKRIEAVSGPSVSLEGLVSIAAEKAKNRKLQILGGSMAPQAKPMQLLYTEGAVIIGLVYLLLPFMILPLYSVFEDLREDYLRASHDLGAGRLSTFIHVIVPLTLPGVLAGIMLVLLPAMGLFFVPDILGGSRNLLVGNVIKNQFLDARNWPFGAAASILLTLAMAFLMFAHRLSKRRIGEDGV